MSACLSVRSLAAPEVGRRTFASLPFAARLSLGDRLAQRKAELLVKPIFNRPPGQTLYPPWLAGTWDVAQQFDGFVFPSRIPRDRIMREPTVPGLQRLSVVSIPDMGKSPCSFQMRFLPAASGRCVEDKRFNLASVVDGSLEARIIQRVEYEPERNPNRLSAVLRPGKERNAERIELFFNSRDSDDISEDTFVASQHLRQVTFGGSVNAGVVRQVSGSYGQYETFARQSDGRVRRNLLTAAYLEPTEQESLYFQAVDQPVIVFSHEAVLTRAANADL